jgi:hypothetical protein
MDILSKTTTVFGNGHTLKVPEGTEIFKIEDKIVLLVRYGSVYIMPKEHFVELTVNFYDGYKASFVFDQNDPAYIELTDTKLNVAFNNRVKVSKKDRNMLTQFLKLHLLPLTPMDSDYKDGRKYYTVDEQKPHRNASKPKESQAKRENNEDVKEDQFNIFENVDADISMEAAFSVM